MVTAHFDEALASEDLLFDNHIGEKLLTLRELASRLRMTESGVYKLVYRNKIPALKVGRLLRFKWEDVLAKLRRN